MENQRTAHLGVIRRWIQSNARNGERVIWGSNEFLELKSQSVRDMEYLAEKIADEAVKEYIKQTERKKEKWEKCFERPWSEDS